MDYIAHCIRGALINVELPQTIATMNTNTGKIEVGLVEEVYADKENTDMPITLKSAKKAPYLISVGIIRNILTTSAEGDDTQVILDGDSNELNCIDQILHLAVDSKTKVHAMTTSKGDGSSVSTVSSKEDGMVNCMAAVPSKLFLANNLSKVIKERIRSLESTFKI